MMRACGLMNAATATAGWSCNRCPTPGSWARTSIPDVAQMPGRTDPGAQQMCRRVDGAGGQDHFVAAKLSAAARDQRLHADAALPSNSSSLTCVSVEMVRFARMRVPGSR